MDFSRAGRLPRCRKSSYRHACAEAIRQTLQLSVVGNNGAKRKKRRIVNPEPTATNSCLSRRCYKPHTTAIGYNRKTYPVVARKLPYVVDNSSESTLTGGWRASGRPVR